MRRAAQRGPAERPFGHHVDEIRDASALHARLSARPAGNPAAALVAWQRNAREQQLLELRPVARSLRVVLARARELDVMPAGQQSIQHPADGHGHAVDFGREGFRDQRDAQ